MRLVTLNHTVPTPKPQQGMPEYAKKILEYQYNKKRKLYNYVGIYSAD